ncbi:hypothetical protein Q4566_05145 [Tamlana sp. 2_MG-2023]|uniref:hypothetical protein n=1 Tax=unclassified Tamlana TaxID=2614803 RepID=UPI0026E44FE6|nr:MULTISPECIES: hypothetical protein [unclassified Tamlana]MDO6759579.1 hypothetical protein [Tamlana sp. 2_MG-2023]MDO6792194.1 hypothetical protein [Tamlana sp. 1_MG-2023]
MNFNTICESDSPNEAFYELLKVLAVDIESEAVLKVITEGAQSFSMEESTLVVRMESGDSLYIYPPKESDSYTKQPKRYQELSAAFSGLSFPEEDDLGLHFGAFQVHSEFPEAKRAFAPIQEYDNWYYYNSDNELCYISHEGGSEQRAKYADTGVSYLYELAELLYLELDEIRASLPFESSIKLVKSKEFISFEKARDSVAQINTSSDGKMFAMPGINADSVRLTTTEGETIKEFYSGYRIFPTAFSSCGSYFAFGDNYSKITVIDMKTNAVKWVFYGDDDKIEPEALVDEATKHTIGESSGHNHMIYSLKSLSFSQDGHTLFSGSFGKISAHSCEAGTLQFSKVYKKKKRSWVTVLEPLNDHELLISNEKVKSIVPSTQKNGTQISTT